MLVLSEDELSAAGAVYGAWDRRLAADAAGHDGRAFEGRDSAGAEHGGADQPGPVFQLDGRPVELAGPFVFGELADDGDELLGGHVRFHFVDQFGADDELAFPSGDDMVEVQVPAALGIGFVEDDARVVAEEGVLSRGPGELHRLRPGPVLGLAEDEFAASGAIAGAGPRLFLADVTYHVLASFSEGGNIDDERLRMFGGLGPD